MKAMQRLLVLPFLASCSAGLAQVSTRPDQVVGVWRGHSVCMVKNSPCHDELNVYRVSAIAEKPGIYLVSGSKIVDGKEEAMGTGEWKHDAIAHVLIYEFPRGVFRLKIEGDKMEGDLKLPDGTLYRQIYLEREK